MTDIAQLGLSIDSSSVLPAATALDQLTVAGQKAEAASDALTAASGRSETMLRAIQSMADRAGVSFDTMNQRVDNASKGILASADSSTKAASASTAHAAALGKVASGSTSASAELGHMDEIAAILESRMLSLGNNTGLFGQVLSVLGPGGLAAAAGIGALVVVVDQLVTSANRMGDFALQIQNLSSVAGVSTTALQALDKEAVGFGLSSSQTGTFLERFTQQLDGVRKGSGTLYTEMLKISPTLLAQMSVAKTTTDALNILSQAYAKAGASSNALSTAAGAGRGSAGGVGLLLGDIAQKGSVDNLVASVNQLDLITQQQTKDWAALKTQIDDSAMTAKNNIASIYTPAVLDAEKAFYDKFLQISEAMKSAADAQGGPLNPQSLFGRMFSAVGLGSHTNAAPTQLSMTDIGGGLTTGVTGPPAGLIGPPAPTLQQSLGVTSDLLSRQVSFLGSAATATDKYNASVAKLNALVADNSDLTGLQSRAMAGLDLTRDSAQASGYSGALGGMPTVPAREEKEEETDDEHDERHLPVAA